MKTLDDFDPKAGGWIGFDLDGTLAHHEGYKGRLHIGAPILKMIRQVKELLTMGAEIRIVTARVAPPDVVDGVSVAEVRVAITNWCLKHIGQELLVTYSKDKDMNCLVDDRAIGVPKNKRQELWTQYIGYR